MEGPISFKDLNHSTNILFESRKRSNKHSSFRKATVNEISFGLNYTDNVLKNILRNDTVAATIDEKVVIIKDRAYELKFTSTTHFSLSVSDSVILDCYSRKDENMTFVDITINGVTENSTVETMFVFSMNRIHQQETTKEKDSLNKNARAFLWAASGMITGILRIMVVSNHQ